MSSQKENPKKYQSPRSSIPSFGSEKFHRWFNQYHTNPPKLWEKASSDAEVARRLLDELKRRAEKKAPANIPDIFDAKFIKQTEFIKDKCRLKAALCTRRAGKSYGAGLYLCDQAQRNPGVSVLYVALTRDSAKRIMFKDVLHVINRKFDMQAKFNQVDLTVTFPNGAVIYLVGLDHSDSESEKILGQKFKLVLIDEAASFRRDLKQIIYGVLKPAVVDLNGTICMIGTPGNFTKSFFHDVTEKGEPGWSVHKWSAFDNPYMAQAWSDEIEDLTKTNPRITETPWFVQNYLGKYVIDQSKLCDAFDRTRDTIFTMPPKDMVHVFGIDLGYNDATSISVLAYSHTFPQIIVRKIFKQSAMNLSQVADVIKNMARQYSPVRMRVDNASKQAVEELKQRYQLPLTPADKTGKADFIEMMNSEYINGRIVLLDGEADELADEYANLIWDDRAKNRQEHPSCDNHAADATLYAWRDCREHLLYQKPVIKTQQDMLDDWEQKEVDKLDKAKRKDWFEDFN